MADEPGNAGKELPSKRLIAGAVIFVTGQMAPLAILGVANSSLPATWKTTLSGLLFFGVPQMATLLAVVVLGRAGFNALKSRLFGWARQTLFPDAVSRMRYRAGLALFLVPILFGWVSPYFYEALPDLTRHRLALAIAGDVALMAGVLLMGGQFWDKLRALFVYDAEVSFPPSASMEANVA